MSNLALLADEILVIIASDLNKPSLSALCQACSRFLSLFEPTVYQNIVFKWSWEGPLWARRAAPPPDHFDESLLQPAIALLLRSLLDRPILASYVHSLGFIGKKPYPKWKYVEDHAPPGERPYGAARSLWKDYPGCFLDHEVMSMHHLVSSLELYPGLASRWIQGFEEGEVDLIMALVLCSCPALATLKIHADFFNTGYLDSALSLSPKLLAGLQNIEFCSDNKIYEDVYFYATELRSLGAVFTLPKLQHLLVCLPSKKWSWRGHNPESALQSLTLHRSGISETDLKQLLRATPHLKSLVFDFCYFTDSWARQVRPAGELFNCGEFADSLSPVRCSLERLVLSIDHYQMQGEDGFWDWMRVSLPALGEFERLRTLEIPYTVLLGLVPPAKPAKPFAEALPPRLQQLTLADGLWHPGLDVWEDVDLLAYISEDLIPQISFLKLAPEAFHLTVRIDRKETLWDHESRMKVEALCREAGVICRIMQKRDAPNRSREHRLPRYHARLENDIARGGRGGGGRGRGRGG